MVYASAEKSDYLVIDQETVDRSAVAHVVGCEADVAYDEDACLFKCLAEKFVGEFGCLHARMKRVEAINEDYSHIRICDFQV